ncbi:MAG: hypothetical protein LC753_09450 [Acidobacteria bacterium]|nr:hypothetical protein [Acidobacteriota bacterium]
MLQRPAGPVVIIVTLAAAAVSVHARQPAARSPGIDVTFTREARTEPVTGMVYVAVSRVNQRTPIEQAGPTGVPLFSIYVEAFVPGAVAAFGTAERGHPIAALRDLPAGEYWMQPFVNVYTRFPR